MSVDRNESGWFRINRVGVVRSMSGCGQEYEVW